MKFMNLQKKKKKSELKEITGEENPRIRLVLIGHSLGGLICRGAIGNLYCKNYFQEFNVLPVSYMSFETPHLGVDRLQEGYTNLFFRFISKFLFYGKTISELYVTDAPTIDSLSQGNPKNLAVLLQLSLPDSDYIKGLLLFKGIYLVNSTHWSPHVPFASGFIVAENRPALERKKMKSEPAWIKCYGFNLASDVDEQYQKELGCPISVNTSYEDIKLSEDIEFYGNEAIEMNIPVKIYSHLKKLPWRRLLVNVSDFLPHELILGVSRLNLSPQVQNYLKNIAKLVKLDLDLSLS